MGMVVGITGGIGAGKSTLAAHFSACGAHLVDADAIGHSVLRLSCIRDRLVVAFGPGVLGHWGDVDRGKLASRAFVSKHSLEVLNQIVRSDLEKVLFKDVQAGLDAGGFVVVDAALIFEWGIESWFDVVILIDAPISDRVVRAAKRSGLDVAEVRRRLDLQMTADEKARRADVLLWNTGDITELRRKADTLWHRWHGRAEESECRT